MGIVVRVCYVAQVLGLVACIQNPPPPPQWQQQGMAPPAPYGSQATAPPPAPSAPGSPSATYTPAPSPLPATYTPCQYMCGTMSRCQLSAYDAGVTDCRNTGTESTDNGRRVLDNFTRMSCEQLAAELRAASTAPSAPPPASPPATPPPAADPAGAGRWISPPHQAYTNAAMVSADFYLDVTLTSSGSFRGTWARYICAGAAYAGVLSCGKGPSEGTATGQLDRTGAGWIDLERLGRSNLRWTLVAGEIQMELPRTWQGDNIAFRSRIKR